MYAIISRVDGGVLQVRIHENVMLCIFKTEAEAYDFAEKYQVLGNIVPVYLKHA